MLYPLKPSISSKAPTPTPCCLPRHNIMWSMQRRLIFWMLTKHDDSCHPTFGQGWILFWQLSSPLRLETRDWISTARTAVYEGWFSFWHAHIWTFWNCVTLSASLLNYGMVWTSVSLIPPPESEPLSHPQASDYCPQLMMWGLSNRSTISFILHVCPGAHSWVHSQRMKVAHWSDVVGGWWWGRGLGVSFVLVTIQYIIICIQLKSTDAGWSWLRFG